MLNRTKLFLSYNKRKGGVMTRLGDSKSVILDGPSEKVSEILRLFGEVDFLTFYTRVEGPLWKFGLLGDFTKVGRKYPLYIIEPKDFELRIVQSNFHAMRSGQIFLKFNRKAAYDKSTLGNTDHVEMHAVEVKASGFNWQDQSAGLIILQSPRQYGYWFEDLGFFRF